MDSGQLFDLAETDKPDTPRVAGDRPRLLVPLKQFLGLCKSSKALRGSAANAPWLDSSHVQEYADMNGKAELEFYLISGSGIFCTYWAVPLESGGTARGVMYVEESKLREFKIS